MTEPFVGEIRPWAFNWAPQDWLLCQGQTLNIQQYIALYSLLGTTYGGNGTTTFMLPDLRGRVPIGQGLLSYNGAVIDPVPYQMGQSAGAETVTLTAANMPTHTHPVNAFSSNGTLNPAANNYFAQPIVSTANPTNKNIYGAPGASGTMVALNSEVISNTGNSAAHNNMQPFLVLNFCICAVGIFPPRP